MSYTGWDLGRQREATREWDWEREAERQQLIGLLRREALQLGSFTLASGRSSHYYVDGRRVTLAAAGAGLIGRGMLNLLAAYPEVGAVGGLSLGADPIVGAMLALAMGRADLRGFLVRREAKSHGLGNLVEGPLVPGARVAIVDDVATTGGSALEAIAAVEALNCSVAVVLVLLDRLEGAAEALAGRGYALRSLVTIRELGVEPLAV